MYTFSYTSGTTGNPKGAMLSHGNFASICCLHDHIKFTKDDVFLSYLPLAHVFERVVCCSIFNVGACTAFFQGDVLKLKEDLQDVRPTIFVSVPRLLNKFYDKMIAGLSALKGCKKSLSQMAVNSKLKTSAKKACYKHGLWDKIIFKKLKMALGGRVKLIITGSAPIAPEVENFFRIAMCCPMLEGYGQTENTAASFITDVDDFVVGHVGGPVISIEFKVVDVKEMNYTSKDIDENGDALPRGELCTRGVGIFKGYYKDEEKTKEALDEDGWLHSGDIVQVNKNGSIKIIDRKKNIFKLSQGEYIAPERIEGICVKCRSVSEIFVHGDSFQSYIIAVIVVEFSNIKSLLMEKKIEIEENNFEKNPEVYKLVIEDIQSECKKANLKGFEVIKKVFIDKESFAINDLLTTTFKLKRHEARKYYQSKFDELYQAD